MNLLHGYLNLALSFKYTFLLEKINTVLDHILVKPKCIQKPPCAKVWFTQDKTANSKRFDIMCFTFMVF